VACKVIEKRICTVDTEKEDWSVEGVNLQWNLSCNGSYQLNELKSEKLNKVVNRTN
jgi:hypothetical protein